MTDPLISVIIPVGPRHAQHCRVAAASVQKTSLAHRCETIIVADGDAEVPPLPGCTVLPSTGKRLGPAKTRNRGIERARGDFVTFLDADDYLLPRGLEHLMRHYSRGDVGYAYGNAYTLEQDGRYVLRSAPDYTQEELRIRNLHVVTVLAPTVNVRAVGGFDEGVDAWEDWTIFLRLGQVGVCGSRVPVPVFVYRVYEGDRMTRWYGGETALVEFVRSRYRDPRTGVIEMASCCGGDATLAQKARGALQNLPMVEPLPVQQGLVRVEFLGQERGSVTYEPIPGRPIKLGANAMHRYADVTREEAAWLAERVPIRVVPVFDDPAPPPQALRPIVSADDVLTPDAQRALRP